MSHSYELSEDQKLITKADLKCRSAEFQIEVMRTWFSKRFQDPVHECPYDGEEGGYLFIYGGPYEAREELCNEFGEFISQDVIERLACEMDDDCTEWSGIAQPDDYDDYFLDIAGTVAEPYNDFLFSINNLRTMLLMEIDDTEHQQALLNMIFISTITSMEVFLSEYFIGKIERNTYLLRRFVETNTDFTKEKFSLSEVFQKRESIEKHTKEYLIGLLWHNLPKIRSIYKKTLNIEFPESIENIVKATHIRHDLVHRAGKSREGTKITLHKNDIFELIDELENFAIHIEQEGIAEF